MSAPIVVTVREGSLGGGIGYNLDGKKFYKFLGIPYAKPPLGELRFKAPQPPDVWTGIRDATKEGDICYSADIFIECVTEATGSEDCLTLNVFTKEYGGTTSLKPVMVFIHGGGFVSGSSRSSTYGPEYLMTEDVVLVTINYRLGILGFLSLDDTSLEVPGNAGLKDQSFALKWIRDNIENFGGDANNVTIFGESAGAGSVHYHVLSKASKGLFHKAILQSGNALANWALGARNGKEFTKALGRETNDEAEILEILKSTPVQKLYEIQSVIDRDIKSASVQRLPVPVIEKPNDTAFLTKSPFEIITQGEYNQVPLIFGYNSKEGMFIEVIKRLGANADELDLETAIPWTMKIKKGSDESKNIVKLLEEQYFKGGMTDSQIYDLFTDILFFSGTLASIKNHLKTSRAPIYFYKVSAESQLNLIKRRLGLQHIPGVCHADELGYLFKGSDSPEIESGSVEEGLVKTFVKLWTNFAKYSDPTPIGQFDIVWEPVKDTNILTYLDIGEKLSVRVNPEPDRANLWKTIFRQSISTENYL